MLTHKRFFIRGGIFLLILLVAFATLTWILLPKTYFSKDQVDTATLRNFYKMQRNSIDVLFLGSSHSFTSFSPQFLYDRYGLRSYNLGTQQQSLVMSYFLLKDALRFQKPKIVVLDTLLAFPYSNESPLNSKESMIRYALDPMQWSPVKVEAIRTVCELDEDQTLSSYYNPLERFHTRWVSLEEDDFAFAERLSHGEMKGYSLLSEKSGYQDYQPFDVDSAVLPEDMHPLSEEYLDKIVQLCEENRIELILVKTPSSASSNSRYNRMHEYAQSRGVDYYDFNVTSMFESLGIDYPVDTYDTTHLNYWGAEKLTDKMGGILTSGAYDIQSTPDSQWADSRAFYEQAARNAELRYITDAQEYLRALQNGDYTVFAAVKDEGSKYLNDELAAELTNLGLQTDLRGAYRSSYYAVISPDGVREELGNVALDAYGSFRDGKSRYAISSAGYANGNDCSIQLDGTEYAKKERGLNIVVYDNLYQRVIDCAVIDTFSPNFTVVH